MVVNGNYYYNAIVLSLITHAPFTAQLLPVFVNIIIANRF